MALEQKLHLKLAQKLVMTPTLQQAIKLLQLSRLELEQALVQEVQANPLLEMNDEPPAEEEAAATEDPPEEEGNSGGEAASESEQASGDTVGAGEPAQDDTQASAEAFHEVELEALFSNYLHDGPSVAPAWEETEEYSLENSPAPSRSMFEDLSAQLHLLEVTPEVHAVCEFIVGNLDPDGYLRLDDEEIAPQLGVAVERIREAVATVQRLEPAGIAARSLQECFLLQLARLPRDDRAELLDLIRRIVAEAFDDLLHQRWDRLVQRFGVEGERSERFWRSFTASIPGRESGSARTRTWRSSRTWWRLEAATAGVSSSTTTVCLACASPVAICGCCRTADSKGMLGATFASECGRRSGSCARWNSARARSLRVATGDRPAPGGVPREGTALPAPARAEGHRRRHRHARIDGKQSRGQQVHGDAARRFPAEVLLPLVHLARG